MIVDPRLADPKPEFRAPEYAEDGSARTPGLYLRGLIPVFGVIILMLRLPLGIRMDAEGIRIGGVRNPALRRDKPIQGFSRARHLYSCDWQGVRRIAVLTEPRDIALMARRFGGPHDLDRPWWSFLSLAPWAPGRFIDPRAKAALVIEVETARATFQATRPPKTTALVDSIYNSSTMIWVIPTKDPARLKAALAAAQPPIPED